MPATRTTRMSTRRRSACPRADALHGRCRDSPGLQRDSGRTGYTLSSCHVGGIACCLAGRAAAEHVRQETGDVPGVVDPAVVRADRLEPDLAERGEDAEAAAPGADRVGERLLE